VTIPSRHGTLSARTYRPDSFESAVALFPGVHAGGIDEPRLVAFAEALAERGVSVAAVDLPDLKHYAITGRTTDMIEDAARWLTAQRELAPEGRVGLIGISFAGGLAVVAAGRESLRGKVTHALSLGGHGDLPRTLRFLCTGRLPDGSYRAPHDYGVVIILLGVADRVVPAEQVEPLRRGIRLFLEASHADMVDKVRAVRLFRKALDYAEQLPEPAATYMDYVNRRDVKALGPRLLPHVWALSSDPGLSPERSPAPRAPVYLLHGSDDNVIPAMESTRLARYLESKTEVRVLLSPLITHAEVDRPADFAELWRLIAFWSDALDE
jgi:dienelactone hydrolase